MAVPKGKISKARKHSRRSAHWKLALPGIVKCPRCQKMKMAHHACRHCGYYDGRQVISLESDKTAKSK
jgi:large subunit ribosomal protein L32